MREFRRRNCAEAIEEDAAPVAAVAIRIDHGDAASIVPTVLAAADAA